MFKNKFLLLKYCFRIDYIDTNTINKVFIRLKNSKLHRNIGNRLLKTIYK